MGRTDDTGADDVADDGVRFCCDYLPGELTTSSNESLIVFQSNMSGVDAVERRGFQLSYSIGSTLF